MTIKRVNGIRQNALEVLFFLSLLLPVTSQALEDDFSPLESEEAFYSEIPSVISATRIRQPLTEAPASITVINRQMIEASGAIEIADIFRLVPGVQVSYPQGNQIAVAYHGFADAFPRNMQVLVDGRSIYLPSFADVDWLFLGVTLRNIDRIEVIRGANSPLYGANAVQGVINIITFQPYQQAGAFISITAGDLDTQNVVAGFAGNAGKLDYRLTTNYQQSSGLPGEIDSTDDGRKNIGLSFRGVYQQSLNDEIDIQFGLNAGDTGAGAEIPDDPKAHDKEVSANYLYINWRHALADGADSELLFYHNTYESVDDYPELLSVGFGISPETVEFILEGIPDQMVQLGFYNYQGERYDLEWQYTSARHGKWQSMFGGGLRLNRIKSPTLTKNENWINETSGRVFANINYRPINSIIAGLGVMAEDSDVNGRYVSPRLSLNYLITPEHSIRMSYTQTQRNPSLLEVNFDQVIRLYDGTDIININKSENTEAETKISSELGFIGYWFERKLLLDVKIFNERTEDVIHELRSNEPQPFFRIPQSAFVYTNDGELEVNGIEMQVKYQFGAKDFISIQAADLSVNSTLRRRDYAPDLWERPSQSVPERTYSALLSHAFPLGFEASVAYYAMSEMYWLGDGDLIEDYQRWDLRLAKRGQVNRSRYNVELIVQNMGDNYATFRYENIFETRVYLRLGVEF